MPLTVRIFHHPSYTPLMELEVDPSETVGALKALVEERLAAGEEGVMKVIPSKWHLELTVGPGGKKRLVEITDGDDGDTLASTGVGDYSIFFIEGPVTDTPEGISKALSIVSYRLRQTQVQQTELLQFMKSVFAKDAEAHARIEKRQEHLCAVATLSLSVMLTNEGTGIATPGEPLGRARMFAEEDIEFLNIMKQFEEEKERLPLEKVNGAASRLLNKYPNAPLRAFWESLGDCPLPTTTTTPTNSATTTMSSYDSSSSTQHDPAVALAIAAHCGINTRSTPDEAPFFLYNGWCPGQGATPIILAAHIGRGDVVQALVSAGADYDLKDSASCAGYSALHCACANGHATIIKFLVTHGANVMNTSADGSIPLKLLEMYGAARCPSNQLWGLRRLMQLKAAETEQQTIK